MGSCWRGRGAGDIPEVAAGTRLGLGEVGSRLGLEEVGTHLGQEGLKGP